MEFLVHTEWPMWFGYAAVAASIVTCAMKTMIPLRFVSMICNALFVIYGFIGGVYVLVFALHTHGAEYWSERAAMMQGLG